jgi:lysophospholipase L1-like esterase
MIALLRAAVLGGLIVVTAAGVWALLALAQRGVFDAPPAARPGVAVTAQAVPPGPLRLGFLGTSLTHAEPWTAALSEALAACRRAPVEAVVVAEPGAASPWGEAALDGLLEARPHAVIVEFAVNDAALHRGVALAESERIHRRLLARLLEAGAAPILATMSDARGLERWKRPGLAAYLALYRRLAAETGAGLIDTAPAWATLDDAASTRFMPDGLHPTPDGVAAVSLPLMTEALGAAFCGDRQP